MQMASPSPGLRLIQLSSVDSCLGPLTLMLLLVGGPSLLQPQGFRSWEERASRDNQEKGVTVWAPGHSLLVTPGLRLGLCVLAHSDFPGSTGMPFPRLSCLEPQGSGVCVCVCVGGGRIVTSS